MAQISDGAGSGVKTGVEASQLALRVSQRPMNVGARGAYSLGVVSGVMAAGLGANNEIFQMRWTSASLYCLIRSINLSVVPGTTAFAAGPCEFTLSIARNWTVDGGGGTPIVFSTANTNKKRTSFGLSAFSDTGVRQSATAALTAGTKTFDTNRFSTVSGWVSSVVTTAASGPIIAPGTELFARKSGEEYPILLVTNEGIAVRATVPATGTWQYSLNVEWTEIDPAVVTGW